MACQRPHIAHRKDSGFVRRQRRQRQVTKKLPVDTVEIHYIGLLEGR
jgi:hypothetical protein